MDGTHPLFTHPGDLTEPIFGVVPLAIGVIAIGICLVGLVRGRLGESALAAGIVTLPVLAFALGNAVLLDRSKETEFCVSCHIMQPIYDSTRADDGSIASLHVARGAVPTAQSCSTCHSGYGMWGNLGAKLSGVQHMLHTVTGSYDLPLKLYQPYDVDGCLQCHAESTRFRAVEVHATPEIQEALVSREMSCTGSCHPPAHPAEALSGIGIAERAVIRLACGLALVALALLVAMLANTESSTAISFSFIAHPALALAIGLYVYLTWGPVRMSDDEQELYELSFSALGRRDFVQLAASGRWEDIPAGEKLFRVGDRVDSVWVLLRGVIAAEVDGERLGELGPGGSAGTTMIVTREPSPIDAIAIEPCRALVWHVETVVGLLEKKPNVRAALQGAVSLDLARKVQALAKR